MIYATFWLILIWPNAAVTIPMPSETACYKAEHKYVGTIIHTECVDGHAAETKK